MTTYKGYFIDPTEYHKTGEFIIYKRGREEVVGKATSVGWACDLIDNLESQTCFAFPDPETQALMKELRESMK